MGAIKLIFKIIVYVIRGIFILFGVLWLLSLMQNRIGEFVQPIMAEIVKFITTKIFGY